MKIKKLHTIKKKEPKKKYADIYYFDDSGDNIPHIVEAMRKMDTNKEPRFKIVCAR